MSVGVITPGSSGRPASCAALMHVLREARRHAELRARLLRLRAMLGLRDRADADDDVVRQLARALDRVDARRRAQRDLEHLRRRPRASARDTCSPCSTDIECQHRNHRAQTHDFAYRFHLMRLLSCAALVVFSPRVVSQVLRAPRLSGCVACDTLRRRRLHAVAVRRRASRRRAIAPNTDAPSSAGNAALRNTPNSSRPKPTSLSA